MASPVCISPHTDTSRGPLLFLRWKSGRAPLVWVDFQEHQSGFGYRSFATFSKWSLCLKWILAASWSTVVLIQLRIIFNVIDSVRSLCFFFCFLRDKIFILDLVWLAERWIIFLLVCHFLSIWKCNSYAQVVSVCSDHMERDVLAQFLRAD